MYKPIRSPIKWVGGKSRLRNIIVNLLPPHTCYVEPFAGAAWVLFAKPPSKVEVINDIDEELVNFFRVIKHKPEEFIRSFKWELVSRAEFTRLASTDPTTLDDVQRAHRFYYIIMAGWGGESHYPRFQTSIRDGGHGNRLIGALKHLEQRILPVYQRLQTVIIENLNWDECITKYDSKETVMYVDPPYPNNGVNYKHNMRDWEEHKRLASVLKQTKSKWILSSYDIPEIRTLYTGFHIIPVQSFSGMKKKKNGQKRVLNREVLILNFTPSAPSNTENNTTEQLSLLK